MIKRMLEYIRWKILKSKKNLKAGLLAGIILLGVFYYLFEMMGLRLFFGILLVYFIPLYLILGRFSLDGGERAIFSFFGSLGLVPLLIYYFGMIGSFRMGLVGTFVLLMLVGLVLDWRKIKSWKKEFKRIELTENESKE